MRDAIVADPDFAVVAEAGDGREALAVIAREAPDLILLDIEMPVLDGLGVLRDWALRGGGAVVVVSSAAVPGGEVAVEARRLGASAVVGKPSGAFSPELAESGGAAIRHAARRALGLPVPRRVDLGEARGAAVMSGGAKAARPAAADPRGAP
ncbi:response regulator [Roseomonas sp. CCTCC AB2023176]|uniref:response regulator n=1 Tax=Roseomonas sp. CCTCC AB2023176 TaxID=3342640 RepID=UPI0035D54FFA